MRVRDFTMTYDSPLTDTLPNQTYAASLTLPAGSTNTVTLDTSIASGSFKIGAAAVGSGLPGKSLAPVIPPPAHARPAGCVRRVQRAGQHRG